MKNIFFLPLLILSAALCLGCSPAQSQGNSRVAYMQIFYEGPNWLAGQEVLHYSPAFKGKTGELVAEGNDTRQFSPGGFMANVSTSTHTTSTVLTTEKGTFVTGSDGKTHLQTAEDLRKANQEEANSMNKGLQLLAKRNGLARAALSNALNEAAADGWEVEQMAAYGNSGGLVYLLHKR